MNPITFQHTGLRTKLTTQQTTNLWQQHWTARPQIKASFLFQKNRGWKKAHSAAVQLLMCWLCRTQPSREAGQLLGFSLPLFKSSVDDYVCITHVPVNLFLHLFVQSLDRETWKCDSSDRSWSHRVWHSRTEAQPPAQALGHSPHNAVARSHPWQGFVARQSHLLHV